MAVEMEKQSETVKLEFDNGDDFNEDDESSNHIDGNLQPAEADDTYHSPRGKRANSQTEEDKTGDDSSVEESIDQTNGHSQNEDHADEHSDEAGDSSAKNSFHSSLAASLSFNFLNESSKMALTDIAIREKRCRIIEREANEVKDVICSLNHMVHILENIKRVSREYIHNLYELIGSTLRSDNEQTEQLQQEILDLESELKQWEHKYHVMSSFTDSSSSFSSLTDTSAALFAANSAVASAAAFVANGGLKRNGNSSTSSEHQEGEDEQIEEGCEANDNSNDIELMESNHRRTRNGSKSLPTSSSSRSSRMMPSELCEMSMETAEMEGDEQKSGQQRRRAAAAAAAAAAALLMNSNGGHHSSSSPSLIAAAVAAAAASVSASSSDQKQLMKQFRNNHSSNSTSSQHNSNGHHSSLANGFAQSTSSSSSGTPLNSGNAAKPLFVCDYSGCSYQTNMRQRLAMHKRAHAGEMLFSCDIAGCGYQSNYKGNIKIHKKHRHRIETSGEQSTYLTTDTNGQQHKFRTRGRKRKCTAINSYQSSQAGSTTPFMVQVNNAHGAPGEMKQFVGGSGARPSVIVSEEGVEAFLDGTELTNGSSCDMLYSGNDSAEAKDCQDLPLYQCNVEGCNYSSKWKQCLTAHQFVHAGVKPFKCDYPGCNYRTNFKGNVNVHKRVHRASEFQCKFAGCNFSTPWKNSFLIHQRNHMPPMMATGSTTAPTATNSGSSNGSPQMSTRSETAEALLNAESLQMMLEPELPVSLSVTSSRRRAQQQQLEGSNNNSISLEVVRNGHGNSSARTSTSTFDRTPLDSLIASELDNSLGDHLLLNEISVMQSHSGRPNADLVLQQQQAASMAAGVNASQVNGAAFNLNGNIKEEDDEEEMEDEEEEEEEEEDDELEFEEGELLPFTGNARNLSDPNGMQAFLMSEAARAAMRHSQNSSQSNNLRSNVMFDNSRYQEMI